MTGRTHTSRAFLALVGASAMWLAACGADSADNGSNDGGVATIATTASTDAPDGTSSTEGTSDDSAADSEAPTDPDEAFELFNECMSEQGFDIEAGVPGEDEGSVVVEGGSGGAAPGEGPVIMGPGGVRIDPEDAEKFDEANKTCSVHLANVENQFELSPEQQAAMEDATLRVEDCMKAKGFDVNIEFSTGGGPGVATAGQASDGQDGDDPQGQPVNPDDIDKDALDAATKECNKIFDEYDELDDIPVPGR